MNERPLVSVVVECVTTSEEVRRGSLVLDLERPLEAIERQTYPRDAFEIIVVIGAGVEASDVETVQQRYPSVRVLRAPTSNYFGTKNAGAEAARGSIVAFVDGDCEPAPDWLERIVGPFENGADVVAGRTLYSGDTWIGRTLSVPDFSVVGKEAGEASLFTVNNFALRRDVLLRYPFDARVRRHGGCYFLYHTLRAEGVRTRYERRAIVMHALGVRYRFLRKHFERGYDGVDVYRLDDRHVLRGTRFFRRFGAASLFPITARRLMLDWIRLARHRREIGISIPAIPYYAAVMTVVRLIELTGGLVAVAAPNAFAATTAESAGPDR
jgi:glycosyltransferase involved in cell wall biosynthesis